MDFIVDVKSDVEEKHAKIIMLINKHYQNCRTIKEACVAAGIKYTTYYASKDFFRRKQLNKNNDKPEIKKRIIANTTEAENILRRCKHGKNNLTVHIEDSETKPSIRQSSDIVSKSKKIQYTPDMSFSSITQKYENRDY